MFIVNNQCCFHLSSLSLYLIFSVVIFFRSATIFFWTLFCVSFVYSSLSVVFDSKCRFFRFEDEQWTWNHPHQCQSKNACAISICQRYPPPPNKINDFFETGNIDNWQWFPYDRLLPSQCSRNPFSTKYTMEKICCKKNIIHCQQLWK